MCSWSGVKSKSSWFWSALGNLEPVWLGNKKKNKNKISRWLLDISGSWRCSFADISLHHPFTLLASDIAAPVVFAVASLCHFLCVRVVAAIAAHHVAAVTASGCFVALSGKWKREKKSGVKSSKIISFNPSKCFSICKILQFCLSSQQYLKSFKIQHLYRVK